MGVKQNNGDDLFENDVVNNRDSFQEHDRYMKVFRRAHPDVWRQWEHSMPEFQENPLTMVKIDMVKGILLSRYSTN